MNCASLKEIQNQTVELQFLAKASVLFTPFMTVACSIIYSLVNCNMSTKYTSSPLDGTFEYACGPGVLVSAVAPTMEELTLPTTGVINGRSLFGIFGLPAEYINLINFSSRKG
jgi:hypothetical protein